MIYHEPCYLAGTTASTRRRARSCARAHARRATRVRPRRARRRCAAAPAAARMWMEEKIGRRINVDARRAGAAAAPAAVIATACPYCAVMMARRRQGARAASADRDARHRRAGRRRAPAGSMRQWPRVMSRGYRRSITHPGNTDQQDRHREADEARAERDATGWAERGLASSVLMNRNWITRR